MEFFKDEIPELGYMLLHADIKDDAGIPVFWKVSEYSHGQGYLKLGINCNWRFLNLNKAFEVVVGGS